MADRVRVVVRFRPTNETEKEQQQQGGADPCVAFVGESEVDLKPPSSSYSSSLPPKQYTFDSVLAPSTTQEELFNKVGNSTVETVMKGYNGTVLAFGQTGSGKTHSMFGPCGGTVDVLSKDSPHFPHRGFLPRVVDSLFERLEALPKEEVSYTLTCSVFELYKENIIDLLGQGGAVGGDPNTHIPQAVEYRIREDTIGGKGIYVENLFAKKCGSASEVMEALRVAVSRRRVASTKSNETSSRSHSLTMLTVEQVNHVKGDSVTRSRLNVVDLAGSEKVGKTQATGDRLKEAQMINLSLTLLGNVIYKLTDGKSVYIPYRDSKLTRLLQESFGGNTVTTLLCHCSPAQYNRDETVSTLQFAARAKQIKNKPRVNRQLSGEELQLAYQRAVEEIRALKERLAVLEEFQGGSSNSPSRANRGGASAISANHRNIRDVMDSINSSVTSLRGSSHQAQTVVATNTGGDDDEDNENSSPTTADNNEELILSLRATIESLMAEKEELQKDLYDRDEKLADALKQVEFYKGKFMTADEQLRTTVSHMKNREQLLEKHKLDLEAEVLQLRKQLGKSSSTTGRRGSTPSSSAMGDVKEMPLTGAAMRIRKVNSTNNAKGIQRRGNTTSDVQELRTGVSPLTPLETMEQLKPSTPKMSPSGTAGTTKKNNDTNSNDEGNTGSSTNNNTALLLRIDELEKELDGALKKLQLANAKINALESNTSALLGRVEDLEEKNDDLSKHLDAKEKLLAESNQQNTQMKRILDALGIDLEEQLAQLNDEKSRNSELSLEAGRLHAYNSELEAQRDQQDFCELAAMELIVKTEDVETIEREADMVDSGLMDFPVMRATALSCLRTTVELDTIFGKLVDTLQQRGKFVTSNLEAQRLNLITDAKALRTRCGVVKAILTSAGDEAEY